MIFTDLAYQQIGATFAIIFIFILAFTIVYRMVMAFRNYIYNGNFGDAECSAFVALTEGDWSDIPKYAFIGYHPGMVVVDAFILTLFSLLLIVVWAPVIVVGLFLLLAQTMRKRIAHKQEFTARLEGTYDDE